MSSSHNAFMSFLRSEGRTDLPLNVLRQFQEFEKLLGATFDSFEDLPPEVAYGMRSFKKIEMLGMALALSGDHPSAQRCLDDIMKRFQSDEAFTDGVTLSSWVLFNFPLIKKGRPNETIAAKVLQESPELKAELSPFVDVMHASRLGLYESKGEAGEKSFFKELFTGKEITVNHPTGIPRGNLAVIRIIELMGKNWLFGDSNEFPAERRMIIEGMVEDKAGIYFPENDPIRSYEMMMRLAGPYWFSIVSRDPQGDILDPNHYLYYYKG
jgi:hypothetical protein